MTVNARTTASLLTGLHCPLAQPSVLRSLEGGSSRFLPTLENLMSVPVSKTDSQGQMPRKPPILELDVLDLEGASLMPSNQTDDAEKENLLASIADAVWLANWFQNNAPAPAPAGEEAPAAKTEAVKKNILSSSLLPAQSNATPNLSSSFSLPVMASEWVQTALIEAPSNPMALFASELSTRIDMPIAEKQKQSTSVSTDKPFNALANASTALPSIAATSYSQPSTFAFPATSQPAPIGLGLLDKPSPKNGPTASDNLRPSEVLIQAPIDNSGSVKLGNFDGFKVFKELGNDLRLPVMPGAAQISREPHNGQKLAGQAVVIEAGLQIYSPDTQWTSNLAGTDQQWFERSVPSAVTALPNPTATVSSSFPLPVMASGRVVPALIEAPSKPLALVSSELTSRMDAQIAEKQKQNPWVSTDKPVNSTANAPATWSSSVADSLSFPSTSEFHAIAQPVSIGLLVLDKKAPKNWSTDSDHLRSADVFIKAPNDSSGSVKLVQSVEFRDSNKFRNDPWMPEMPGSAQVILDPNFGQNLTHLTMSTEAVPQSHSPDAQGTSNLTDTIEQWVDRSLQLAELTLEDAGQERMQVRIELNGQEATVYFLTDHVQYRDAIESQIENLSHRLADLGLKLAGSFVGQGGAQNSPHKQAACSRITRRPESELASAKVLTMDPVLREMKSVHHGHVLDVFV